ncbi:Lactadherin [Exaiptasia diaphana]|nr:Lactadherin [Exaiptasia diaphana]
MLFLVLVICVLIGSNGCNSPLGMRDGSIPDSRISASSYYHYMASCYPKHGRLHDSSPWAAWCALKNRIGHEYLQIDLVAPCKRIRNPESTKKTALESGIPILESGIQKSGIQQKF